jgi:hypothetical protein
MAHKIGQIIRRGSSTWLVRITPAQPRKPKAEKHRSIHSWRIEVRSGPPESDARGTVSRAQHLFPWPIGRPVS